MSHFRKILAFLSVTALAACSAPSGADIYTLYRSSTVSVVARVHVGTFDAVDGESYNRENCQLAAELFQRQPGIETKFWCEKGRFRQ